MSSLLASPGVLGAAALALAVLIGLYLLISPGAVRVPRSRRRPQGPDAEGLLTRATAAVTAGLDQLLRRRGTPGASALEQAGIAMRLQDFALLVIVGALVVGALGLLLGGPLLGLLLAALVPFGAKMALGLLAGRRRAAFAEQLDDSLQLMASSLRAGHSLLQALASVSREAEEPTSVEFSRIINETRVGRDLTSSLKETADRMESQDFVWVAQAISINREVGGNLADVLDGVGHTIRERNQIRRQVKSLAAEGKMSAIILMSLPFGIGGFLGVANPDYIMTFTESFVGYILMGVAIVMLTIGGLWLRKIVNFKF